MPMGTLDDLLEKLDSLGLHISQNATRVLPVISCTEQYVNGLETDLFLQKAGLKSASYDFDSFTSNTTHFDLIVLLFGDREMSSEIAQSIRSMRKREFLLVPIVIFSKGYFEIPDNEIFGYDMQVRNIREICKSSVPVTVLCEDDVRSWATNAADYFITLKSLLVFLNTRDKLNESRDELEVWLRKLCEVGSKEENYFQLALVVKIIKEVNTLIEMLERVINEDLNNIRANIDGKITLIQRNNDERNIQRVARYKNNGRPWMARDFGYEYLDISHNIERFLENTIKTSKFSELKNRIGDTKSLLDFSTTISILGTFSSGKTTWVNTLLGTKLRTTSGHNTSILTEIKYNHDSSSRVEFEYKRETSIDLVRPGTDTEIASEAPVAGKIIDIVNLDQLKTVILEDERKEIVPVYLGGKEVNPRIQVGSLVKQGDKLSDGLARRAVNNYYWLSSYGKTDIKAILKLIFNGTLRNCSIDTFDRKWQKKHETNKKKVIRLLQEIHKFAPENYGDFAIQDNGKYLNSNLKDIIQVRINVELSKNN
ncbi:MAG: hypothetical protein EHM20_04940, partial [Alphaproteobacteria bacterium]